MTEKRNRQEYTSIEGILITPGFSAEAFRSVVDYKPKPGDLFIVTYPKCGTTWMQFIVMALIGKPIKSLWELRRCTPFLEMTGIDAIDLMDEKGAFKIHLPLRLAPFSPEAKYIYVARNPKDCCVSFYHHTKTHPLYQFEDGTFDEYFEFFINGEVDFGDYFDHLIPWYNRRNDPNILFLTYEDMKKDIKSEVLKVAQFLGEEYYESLQNDPKLLEDVVHYSSLDYMKNVLNNMHATWTSESETDEEVKLTSGLKHVQEYLKARPARSENKGQLVRKGTVGDWKNHFTPEQKKRMEEWIRRKTEGSDVMNLWKDL